MNSGEDYSVNTVRLNLKIRFIEEKEKRIITSEISSSILVVFFEVQAWIFVELIIFLALSSIFLS